MCSHCKKQSYNINLYSTLAILTQTSSFCCATTATLGPRRVTIEAPNKASYFCQMSGLDQRKIYPGFLFFPHPVTSLILQFISLVPPSSLPVGKRTMSEKCYLFCGKILTCTKVHSCPSCQEQGMPGLPCTSDFEEKGKLELWALRDLL